MMKKGLWTLALIALVGFLFGTVGVIGAADVADQVTIENKGYKADKKGPVKLSHKKHSADYKVACAECHHEYKDGKNVWKEGMPVKKCSACHDPEAKKDKADKLQNAYHKNCQGCHKEKYPDKAPYKKCNDCHQGGKD